MSARCSFNGHGLPPSKGRPREGPIKGSGKRGQGQTSDFEAAKLTATKLGMLYWGVDLALTYTFPKVDYNPLP